MERDRWREGGKGRGIGGGRVGGGEGTCLQTYMYHLFAE